MLSAFLFRSIKDIIPATMPPSLDMNEQLAEAMTWPLKDRLKVAESLVASVPYDSEVEQAQLAKVHRRIAEDRSGQTTRIPGQVALSQVRRAILGGPDIIAPPGSHENSSPETEAEEEAAA